MPFNCTAVPRDMLESQLFGYRKGAFTGADDRRSPASSASAAGGTLFLDEIAEVGARRSSPSCCASSRPTRSTRSASRSRSRSTSASIAATNANLEQLVAEGRFREDLFYRLNVVRLQLPPLRERREEIPPLVEHYLRKYGDEQKKGPADAERRDARVPAALLVAGQHPAAGERGPPDGRDGRAGRTLTPALLSPEIQASRRTIPALRRPPNRRCASALDQPLPAAVELLEQTMVTPRAATRARPRRGSGAAAGHLAEGIVPEAPPLGPQQAAARPTSIRLGRAPASPAGCGG